MKYDTNDPLLIFFLSIGKGTPVHPQEDGVSELLGYRSFTMIRMLTELDIPKQDYYKLVSYLASNSRKFDKYSTATRSEITKMMAEQAADTESIGKMPYNLQQLTLAGQTKFAEYMKDNPKLQGLSEDLIAVAEEHLKDPDIDPESKKSLEAILGTRKKYRKDK